MCGRIGRRCDNNGSLIAVSYEVRPRYDHLLQGMNMTCVLMAFWYQWWQLDCRQLRALTYMSRQSFSFLRMKMSTRILVSSAPGLRISMQGVSQIRCQTLMCQSTQIISASICKSFLVCTRAGLLFETQVFVSVLRHKRSYPF